MIYTKLQDFFFKPIDCSPEGLYFTGTDYELSNNCIIMNDGSFLDFTTYFNIFSWNKWYEYTGLKTLSLYIEISGQCSLRIKTINSEGRQTDFFDVDITSDKNCTINIPERMLKDHISLVITAKEKVILSSVSWVSNTLEYDQEVKLAGVFCTYNRDKYLFKNLNIIKENLPDSFETIVIDNGSRISEDKIQSYGDKFSIYHNTNTGGSGGFTRGILEALRNKRNFTHILLMDDDIHIEPGILQRTITLFRHIKPELRNHFISGAMLLLDNPHMMFESTAQWNGFRIKGFNKDLNLLDPKGIIRANRYIASKNKYAAWWYCAFPINNNIEKILPFPFFIYGDDIEFSLSHAEGFLTLNGIGVWHEPFNTKFSPLFKSYFFCRNTLIVNALHPKNFSRFHTLLNASFHFYKQLLVHDYRSLNLVLKAISDFIKGAEHILSLSELDLLKSKTISGNFINPNINEIEKLYIIPANFNISSIFKIFFHKRLGVTNHENDKIEIRVRSWKKILLFLFQKIKLSLILIVKYKKITNSFKNMDRDSTFWKKRYNNLKKSSY